MFDKLFLSFYFFFRKKDRSIARYSTICVLVVIQIFLLATPLMLIKWLWGFKISGLPATKLSVAPFTLLWIFLVWRFYSKDKIQVLLAKYAYLNVEQKKQWFVRALVFFIALIILFFVLGYLANPKIT